MGHLKTFTHRAFIVRSVAIAEGVVFGGWKLLKTSKNPFEPNRGRCVEPLTIIDQKRTTVILLCAKGQGIQTTLAALVAEQFDVTLSEINVEREPPA